MAALRQAFPTPRGDGKSDPEGGVQRLPDIVARHLWRVGATARRAPSRKPLNGVVGSQELRWAILGNHIHVPELL